MERTQILLTILLMALVTLVPRVLPLWVMGARALPTWFSQWLKYVPVSLLAAMVVPQLLSHPDPFGGPNLYMLAALPSFLIGFASRNLLAVVGVGMGLLAGLRAYLY